MGVQGPGEGPVGLRRWDVEGREGSWRVGNVMGEGPMEQDLAGQPARLNIFRQEKLTKQ